MHIVYISIIHCNHQVRNAILTVNIWVCPISELNHWSQILALSCASFLLYIYISDINECAPYGGVGQCAHLCTNTPGSFQCSCSAGYTLSGYACIGEKCIHGHHAFFMLILYFFILIIIFFTDNIKW